MKTYTSKKTAFREALLRSVNEGHKMVVLHSNIFMDFTVRRDHGQKNDKLRTLVAITDQVEITDHNRKDYSEWRVTELVHGLNFK